MGNPFRTAGIAGAGAIIGGTVLCLIPGGQLFGAPLVMTAAGAAAGFGGGAVVGAGVASATEPDPPRHSSKTVNKAKTAAKKKAVDDACDDLCAVRANEVAVRVLLAFGYGATDGDASGTLEGYVLGVRGLDAVTPSLRKELDRLRETPPDFQQAMGLWSQCREIPNLERQIDNVLALSKNTDWRGWFRKEVA